jgi:hypothetical protein
MMDENKPHYTAKYVREMVLGYRVGMVLTWLGGLACGITLILVTFPCS